MSKLLQKILGQNAILFHIQLKTLLTPKIKAYRHICVLGHTCTILTKNDHLFVQFGSKLITILFNVTVRMSSPSKNSFQSFISEELGALHPLPKF